ncbi:hypothetical protein F2Q70_00010521 [Brassica cretica]|uniref:Uncharacterized protein n=1 Tax=Brassica cretica TaxID=69181 RepID=A0A8S9M3N0_BRACR|nr:hypothetical protein F2Q70_00010521 [Brassica cretica]
MLVIGGLPGLRFPVSFGASFAFSTVVWAGGPNLRVAGTISAEEELVSVHVIAVLRVLAMVSSLENFLSGTGSKAIPFPLSSLLNLPAIVVRWTAKEKLRRFLAELAHRRAKEETSPILLAIEGSFSGQVEMQGPIA